MLNDFEVDIQVEIQEDDNNSVSSHKILKKEKVKKTQKKKKNLSFIDKSKLWEAFDNEKKEKK